MSTLEGYFAFAKNHPELFVNPPSGGFTIIMNEDEIREIESFMMQKLQSKGLPAEWARVGIVYEDQHGRILRDAVRFPGGAPGTYIRFVSREVGTAGVVVIPLCQGNVLLLRRFRHATRSWHLGVPLGPGTKETPAEESARRTLLKDIEAPAKRLVPLGRLDYGPGMASDGAELFYAEVTSYGNANMLAGITDVLCVDVPTFERMINENQITDGFTIVVYLRAKVAGLL